MTGEKRKLTELEYRELDLLSSSDLRQFVKDRQQFYKEKILGEKKEEEYNRASLIGSLVHCILLEPQEFDNKYFMSICSSPPTGLMLSFVESLYKHSVESFNEKGEVTEDFEVLTEKAYNDSGFKITKAKVLENFSKENKKTGECPKTYYDQLMLAKSKGLEVVCVDDINIAEKIVKQIQEDEFVGPIFAEDSDNEVKVEGFEVNGLKMKAMIDKIVVNHKARTIQIYDLKVVYDPLEFKKEYWLKKTGYIQGFIYWKALMSGKLDLGFEYDDYEILPPKYIVAHSGCFYNPLIYSMTIDDLDLAYYGFQENSFMYPGVKEITEDIKWALETNNWKISKKDWENLGNRTF